MVDLRDLKQRTAMSAIWSVLRVGWTTGSTFVIFAILTRLLSPEDFGVYTLAIGFVELTRVVAAAGLSDAITRERSVDEDLASTAFWANVGIGAAVGLGIAALAKPYGAIMRQPEIVPVLYALAPLVPLCSLGGIHLARKLRDFGHKAVAAGGIVASTSAGVAAIAAAGAGWGVWSLVVQTAVLDVVGLIVAWRTYRWRPRLVFRWSRLRSLLAFSSGMVLTQLLWLLLNRVPDLVIGRIWGAAAVGSYRIALRMIDFVGQTVTASVGNVALVTLARLQDDGERFRSAYGRIVGLVGLVTMPVIFGFGAVAHEAIGVIFGGRWDASAPLAMVLALTAAPGALNCFAAAALVAKGCARVVAQMVALDVVLTVAVTAAAAPHGLMAIAAAWVLRSYLITPYVQWALHRYAGVSVTSALRALWGPLLASLGMVACLIATRPLIQAATSLSAAQLILQILAGAAIYAAGLALFARPLLVSHGRTLLSVMQLRRPWLQAERPLG